MKMSETVVLGKSSLRHLPPSAQKVYHILRSQGIMRVTDIQSQTHYSFRMIRYALRRLLDQHLVSQVSDNWYCYFTINQ
ncbi:MAG: MarR family transcriptional regulator [Candidatus Hodarchaeota archaeon]